MTKIDKVLKKLSELYEFNRKIKAYNLKEMAIGIGSSLTATPSHTTQRTSHVLSGSADQAERGAGRNKPSGSK